MTTQTETPKTVFLLFQTDIWQSTKSYVCFGVFDSFEQANAEAKKNNLYTPDANVVIEKVQMNIFAEVI